MANEDLRKNGKAVTEFVKKVVTDLSRSDPDSKQIIVETNETSLLRSAAGFLSAELNAEVYVFSADDDGLYDPQNKSKAATPGRPAILLE